MLLSRCKFPIFFVLFAAPAIVAAQLTPEQMLETARQWEIAVATENYDKIDRLWSDEGFFQRITAGVEAPPEMKQMLAQRLGTNRGRAGVEQYVKNRGKVGGYKLLTIIKRPDGPHAIFRVVDESGLDYHELIAGTVNGAIRIVDVYVYRTGESVAQAFRRGFVCEVAAAQKRPIPPQYLALAQMQQAAAAQNFKGVLQLFESQPQDVKNDKLVQLVRIQSALRVGTDEYTQARSDYAQSYKADATPDLLALDPLLLAGKHKECNEAIDRLDAAVSGDPYLLVLRAGVAAAEGKTDTARVMCDQALMAEPTLLPAADALLTDALERKDFKTAKALMLKMEREMAFTFGPLDQAPQFRSFVQSDEYFQFEKERPRR